MAWGFWKKIKDGFSKVGRAIVKGASWVNDKIVKPFKPIVKAGVSAVANAFGGPAAGLAASAAVDAVSSGIDGVNNMVNRRR